MNIFPQRPLLDIEQHFLVEVGALKLDLGESKDALSHVSELIVGILDLLDNFVSEVHDDTVDNDAVASDEHSIGGTLKVDAEVVFDAGGVLLGGVHVSDEEVELDVGGEVDLEELLLGGGVAVDGVVVTVLFNTFGGPAGSLVDIAAEERLDELDETGLGGITFDTLVDEITRLFLFRKSYLGILNSPLHLVGGLGVPVLLRGERAGLHSESSGVLLLGEAHIGRVREVGDG